MAAYIVGALPIDQFNGLPGPKGIVPPGCYFRIEELASGARPGPGKAWIRHENCVCYEVDMLVLASVSKISARVSARKRFPRRIEPIAARTAWGAMYAGAA